MQDGEIAELQVLLALLYGQDMLQPSCDSWRWGLRGDGLFTVKSFYQSMLVREETTFPYSAIWIPRAPTNVCFFAWLAARGVILTAENLRKRGITLVNWCYMYKSSGEEVDHLMLHCPVSSALWRAILNLFGVQWVMPSTVKEMLYSWGGFRRRRKQKAWKFAPLALIEAVAFTDPSRFSKLKRCLSRFASLLA
uniref:Reverse transcriptase zinc-binding domain-containing protein n=1 Tax=Nicotiana tabacum TaxID=4097 RepID=A0A1S4D7I3_TOBAC|nr:PREDICTED: uncharacterized protein LOC107826876 [Nicotiana tabacum]